MVALIWEAPFVSESDFQSMRMPPIDHDQWTDEVRQILTPLARREPIDFDFDSVLAQRAEFAERRLASESILRGDSRTTTVSKLEIGRSADLTSPRAETAVRKDTLAERRTKEE